MNRPLRDHIRAANEELLPLFDSLAPEDLHSVVTTARNVAASGNILQNLIAALIQYGPQLAQLIAILIKAFGNTPAIFLMLLLLGQIAASADQPPAKPGDHVQANGTVRHLGLRPLTPAAKQKLKAAPHITPKPAFDPQNVPTIDLRPKCPPVLDQNGYNCCAACSGTLGHRLAEILAGNPDPLDSVADLYDRVNGGVDEGADLQQCVTAMSAGVAPNTLVPDYEIPRETAREGVAAARARNPLETADYLDSEPAMLAAIESGKPVYFGINVTSRFKPDRTGYIGRYGGMIEGGHAVLAIGASSTGLGRHAYIVRNSWGTAWGKDGNCLLDSSWAQPETYGAFALTGRDRKAPPPPLVPPTPSPIPAATVASPPAPSGTRDTIVGTYFAPLPGTLPQVAWSLAGSASTRIELATWQLTDTGLVTALCTAAAGQLTTATLQSSNTNPADPVTFWNGTGQNLPTSGTLSFTGTSNNGTAYGPWPYDAVAATASPGTGQIANAPDPTQWNINRTDRLGVDHGTAFEALSADNPVTLTATYPGSPVAVKVALNLTGGTNTLQHQLARQLVASGGTVWSCHFKPTITNNFETVDGTYSLIGNYYFSPSAVQVGSYLTAVSGTNTATACETTFASLISGGTVTAMDRPTTRRTAYLDSGEQLQYIDQPPMPPPPVSPTKPGNTTFCQNGLCGRVTSPPDACQPTQAVCSPAPSACEPAQRFDFHRKRFHFHGRPHRR